MGKLKLVDTFDKSCLIINFIFSKDNGYSPSDIKILQFMLSKPPDEVKKSIYESPQKKIIALDNSLVKARRVTIIWNYSIILGLLYTSFEIRKFCALLAFTVSANLICQIVNQ